MLSRQFHAGVAVGIGMGSLLAAVLVEQGLVTQRSRSWLMGLQALSGVAALVLLWPLYRRSRAIPAADRPEVPVD